MIHFSTRAAAKKLGLPASTLSNYIVTGKIPSPETVRIGDLEVHSWTEEDIERVRKLLPKIANGRKTRWQRQRAQQQSFKGKTKTPKKKK
jgi:hypothetical protein